MFTVRKGLSSLDSILRIRLQEVKLRILNIILLLLVAVAVVLAQGTRMNTLVVIDDKASIEDILLKITVGDGLGVLEEKDVYKEDNDGKAALRVNVKGGDGQSFNPKMPDWNLQIDRKPIEENQFRYITFAWKDIGGDGIQLQLHTNENNWGHRYHAGVNLRNWNPSIQVSEKAPAKWEVHTRDLIEDWKDLAGGGQIITGIAFTAWDGKAGLFDHVAFHQTPEDPLAPQAVDAEAKLTVKWAEIKY